VLEGSKTHAALLVVRTWADSSVDAPLSNEPDLLPPWAGSDFHP
jgi:hypothetical protein